MITDISGVKGIFEKALPEILRSDVDFIIGHPMAGGEKEGYGEKIRIELLKDLDDMSVAGRFNDIVDRLFMVGYLCVKTAWSSFSLEALGMSNNCDKEHNINVIGQTFTKTFRAKNGDFNIDVEFGPTGAFIR